MRIILTAAIVAMTGVSLAAGTADAAKRRGGYETNSYSYGQRERGTSRSRNEGDKARADNADPARQYGGYPDWARFAFSGRGNRGGR